MINLFHTQFTEKLLKSLILGNQYTRESLVPILDVKNINALRKGVIGKTGEDFLLLFVTEKNRSYVNAYRNHLCDDILFWEGENGHLNDAGIIGNSKVLFLMYRELDHTPFTYLGKLELLRYLPQMEEPSKFVFLLVDYGKVMHVPFSTPDRNRSQKVYSPLPGLGLDVFRQKAINLWGMQCVLTGMNDSRLLITSHIKPWKESTDQERIDGYNSVLFTPNYSRLFNAGLITFNSKTGDIETSKQIQEDTLRVLGVIGSERLRFLPDETRVYLDYHRTHLFNFTEVERPNYQFVV